MAWVKKGLIYCPEGNFGWDQSHAQVPTAILLKDNSLRVYYSTRNNKNQSQVSFIDVDPKDPSKIVYVHPEPILLPGMPGTFDDCGTTPSWAVYNGDTINLYYIGWNVRNTVPFHNSIGLAVSTDGINFKRFSSGPLLERNYKEPYFSASLCVLFDNNVWKNWYLSCTEFREIGGLMEPRYHIKYAESDNGIDWNRNGVIAIDYKSEIEAGLAKPSVIKDGDKYKMWFSYRNFNNYRTDKNNSYRIGYAESLDGIQWKRNDDIAGIEVSKEENWDSNMIEYPHVIDCNGRRFMFYNGNGFGKTGFGYAEFKN